MLPLHLLAVWEGAVFYFFQKMFFWMAERAPSEKWRHIWKTIGWGVYPVGMPGWLYVFWHNDNWIAGSVEAAGIFGMFLGLRNELKGVESEPPWLNWVVRGSMVFGLCMSFENFGGFNTWNQLFEILLNVGFFFGVYYLGKKKPSGYLWFLLMLGSNAALQGIQGTYVLMWQQILSIAFIADAYRIRRRKEKAKLAIKPLPAL